MIIKFCRLLKRLLHVDVIGRWKASLIGATVVLLVVLVVVVFEKCLRLC